MIPLSAADPIPMSIMGQDYCMPDTLLRKEPAQVAREAGTAVVSAPTRLKDGITDNRSEMLILAGTILFVVLVALLGVALISAG
jgi:hypothetical protein